MIWEDILVDRLLADHEIVETLITLLGVSPKAVLLTEDIANATVAPDVAIIVERRQVHGEFSMHLSLYIRESIFGQVESLPNIAQFCELLRCKCLVSDKSPNPYTMMLVLGRDDIRLVSLDVQRLDEKGEYVIKASDGK